MSLKKVKETKSEDLKKATEILEKARKENEDNFIKELELLQKKYNVALVLEGRFSGTNIETGIKVVSL